MIEGEDDDDSITNASSKRAGSSGSDTDGAHSAAKTPTPRAARRAARPPALTSAPLPVAGDAADVLAIPASLHTLHEGEAHDGRASSVALASLSQLPATTPSSNFAFATRAAPPRSANGRNGPAVPFPADPAHPPHSAGGACGGAARGMVRSGSSSEILSTPAPAPVRGAAPATMPPAQPHAGKPITRSNSFGTPSQRAAPPASEPADAPPSRPGHRRADSLKGLGSALAAAARADVATPFAPSHADAQPGEGDAAAQAASPCFDGSLFSCELKSMEEVLSMRLPLGLDALQESLEGMDCEHSRFGTMLCRRLGYLQVNAASWAGNEAVGLTRDVSMVVKCPPKPMLPDVTRVAIRHRMVRQCDGALLLLEREVCTLDVPYGDTFAVQERWIATEAPHTSDDLAAVDLRVYCHVHFRSRSMLAAKIRQHSHKKSRKVAALAAELLEQALVDDAAASSAVAGGADAGELAALRERFDALLEEATYYKRHAQALERENKRLAQAGRYTSRSKKQLAKQLVAVEELLHKERRERAAMEEALSEAYSATLREVVALHEASAALPTGKPAPAGGHAHGSMGKVRSKLLQRGIN